MNIGIHVPIGGNEGVHQRAARHGGDWRLLLAEIAATAKAIGATAVQLHNPGLGPVLPDPVLGTGPGDPASSQMPMDQLPVPRGMADGIRDLINAGLSVHVYVGSPNHDKPSTFTGAGMRAALDPWLGTGADLILDHAADAADGGDEWLEWLGRYTHFNWNTRIRVEPETNLWPWWAPSHRLVGKSIPAYEANSIVLVQRPAPGPYDAPKDVRIAWVLAESARFVREGFAGEVQIPLYVAEALANDPERLEAWRAACRPKPPATT